jgi:undecaprenyl-diphosphatase
MVVSFDIVVHLGALLEVVAYFREDLLRLIRGVIAREKQSLQLTLYLIIGSIPAVIFGFGAKDYLERLFGSASATAWQLIFNGLLLLIVDRLTGERKIDQLNTGDAWWIGVGQAIAIIPGISRSGATIGAGLWRKLSRQAAARFSFLLSIPVILGAGLLEFPGLIEGGYQQIGALSFWSGFIGSAVTGYLVIRFFLNYLQHGTLKFSAIIV